MYDMAGGGKIMLELFIMNFLAAGVIYMQYCGLFSVRTIVSFSGGVYIK